MAASLCYIVAVAKSKGPAHVAGAAGVFPEDWIDASGKMRVLACQSLTVLTNYLARGCRPDRFIYFFKTYSNQKLKHLTK